MEHTRLGELPRTQKWQEVVVLVAGACQVSNAVVHVHAVEWPPSRRSYPMRSGEEFVGRRRKIQVSTVLPDMAGIGMDNQVHFQRPASFLDFAPALWALSPSFGTFRLPWLQAKEDELEHDGVR